ncbi:MAG: elongation factor P [Bacteroidales bacterium]|nr:elongation factor P [Bacteroidales bacterium]
MATTADIRNGLTIIFNNDLYKIVEFLHVKPGKGAAFVRTKLKGITNGKTFEYTFQSGAKLEIARVERRPFQYLYKDDMGYNFMHRETYEQIAIQEDLIEGIEFLKGEQEVEIVFDADTETALFCELPQYVVLEVTYTEPGLKGDTSSSTALKPATLETGNEIKVPLFIKIGEKIKVDVSNKSYVERAK